MSVSSEYGVYRVHIPGGVWIDLEAATVAAERAVAGRRNNHLEDSWADATIAACISQRIFLPGDEGAWVESTREKLRQTRISALDSLLYVQLQAGMPEDALRSAEELVQLDPYRDQAYIGLMRALSNVGNPSRAIAVYHQLRHLLAEELGIDPSPEAEALYLDILRRDKDTKSGLSPVLP
jgi:SARP family transcriptional regulator, regulator of embCAB operon